MARRCCGRLNPRAPGSHALDESIARWSWPWVRTAESRTFPPAPDRALSEAVGLPWQKQNPQSAAKASMDQLVAALEKALGDDIKTLPWMSEETKKDAEEKLSLIRNKIGYPEHWRDYSALKVNRDELIGNLRREAVFARDWNLNHLG